MDAGGAAPRRASRAQRGSALRVWIVSVAYPPEAITAAGLASDLSEAMTQRGHAVTVLAPFPNRPGGRVHPGYRRRRRTEELTSSARVVRLWGTVSRRPNALSRLAENLSFGLTSAVELWRRRSEIDVAYLNTWPVFAQWLATRALAGSRTAIVCAVKDLYPESGLPNLPLIPRSVAASLTRSLSAAVYRRSRSVTVLSEVMKQQITASRRVDPSTIEIVDDWRKPWPEPGRQDGIELRQRLGLGQDEIVAMFAGSVSRTAGVDLYLTVADHLRHEADVHLVIAGEGADRSRLEREARQAGLTRLHFVHPVDTDQIAATQAGADVLVLGLRPGTAAHATPSKLIAYMFSAKPILASVPADSSPARIVQEAGCGEVLPPGDAVAVADAIVRLGQDPALRVRLGRRGRDFALQRFSADRVLPRLCGLLEAVAPCPECPTP